MVPIKFRARNLKTDELITGYGIYADPPAEPDAKGRIKETWVRRTFIIIMPYPIHKPTCWIDVNLVDEKGKEVISDTATLEAWVQKICEPTESDNRGSKERGYDLNFAGCKLVLKNN